MNPRKIYAYPIFFGMRNMWWMYVHICIFLHILINADFILLFQFEGGLYATALVLDAAYKLADTAKKAPTIAEVGSYMLNFV